MDDRVMENVAVIKGRNIDFPVSQKIVSDPFAGYYGD